MPSRVVVALALALALALPASAQFGNASRFAAVPAAYTARLMDDCVRASLLFEQANSTRTFGAYRNDDSADLAGAVYTHSGFWALSSPSQAAIGGVQRDGLAQNTLRSFSLHSSPAFLNGPQSQLSSVSPAASATYLARLDVENTPQLPLAMTLDAQRRIVYADAARRRIVRLEHPGTRTGSNGAVTVLLESDASTPLAGPEHVVVSTLGHVYFIDGGARATPSQSNKLRMLSATTGEVTDVGMTGTQTYLGLALTPNERALVVTWWDSQDPYVHTSIQVVTLPLSADDAGAVPQAGGVEMYAPLQATSAPVDPEDWELLLAAPIVFTAQRTVSALDRTYTFDGFVGVGPYVVPVYWDGAKVAVNTDITMTEYWNVPASFGVDGNIGALAFGGSTVVDSVTVSPTLLVVTEQRAFQVRLSTANVVGGAGGSSAVSASGNDVTSPLGTRGRWVRLKNIDVSGDVCALGVRFEVEGHTPRSFAGLYAAPNNVGATAGTLARGGATDGMHHADLGRWIDWTPLFADTGVSADGAGNGFYFCPPSGSANANAAAHVAEQPTSLRLRLFSTATETLPLSSVASRDVAAHRAFVLQAADQSVTLAADCTATGLSGRCVDDEAAVRTRDRARASVTACSVGTAEAEARARALGFETTGAAGSDDVLRLAASVTSFGTATPIDTSANMRIPRVLAASCSYRAPFLGRIGEGSGAGVLFPAVGESRYTRDFHTRPVGGWLVDIDAALINNADVLPRSGATLVAPTPIAAHAEQFTCVNVSLCIADGVSTLDAFVAGGAQHRLTIEQCTADTASGAHESCYVVANALLLRSADGVSPGRCDAGSTEFTTVNGVSLVRGSAQTGRDMTGARLLLDDRAFPVGAVTAVIVDTDTTDSDQDGVADACDACADLDDLNAVVSAIALDQDDASDALIVNACAAPALPMM